MAHVSAHPQLPSAAEYSPVPPTPEQKYLRLGVTALG